jgi:hypothetical protein
MIDTSEEIDIFSDDDWEFISRETLNEFENFEYFSDVKDVNLEEDSSINKVLTIVIIALCGVLVVTLGIILIRSVYTSSSARAEVSAVSNIESIENIDTTLDYIEDGEEVDNDKLVKCSKTINGYFSELGNSKSLSGLMGYCTDNTSVLGNSESAYRNSVKYSYDYNDCYARSLRGFSKEITLSKVDKVLKKDDKYYCYLTLQAPYFQGFSDYYSKYSADMRQFFTQEQINSIGVMKYIIRVLGFNDLPMLKKQYLLILDSKYKITDDSTIQEICTNCYTYSVDNITSKLGSSIDLSK